MEFPLLQHWPFVTSTNDKCYSTRPSASQLKHQQKKIRTEEKLDVISSPEKGE
jgi:hypothetical protein